MILGTGVQPIAFSRRTGVVPRGGAAFTPASLPGFVSAYLTDANLYKESVGLTLVCKGDSLTSGYGGTAGQDYPAQLIALLNASITIPVTVENKGVPSQTVDTMVANGAADCDGFLTAPNQKKICILWGGINDYIASTSGASVYADQVQFCEDRIAAGFQSQIVCTVTPSVLVAGGDETKRNAGNALLRADFPTHVSGFIYSGGAYANYMIDLDADARLAVPAADGTHFNDAQYGYIAADIKPALNLLGIGNAPTSATAANDTVGQWLDSSGLHSYGSEIDSRSPLLKKAVHNGRDMVLFDGSNDLYKVRTPYSLGTNFTLYMIYRPVSTAALNIILFGSTAGFPLAINGTDFYSRTSNGTDAQRAHGGLSNGTTYLLCVRRVDTLFQFFVNGVQAGADVTIGSNAASGISHVGEYVVNPLTISFPMSAHVGDHWIFNVAHSPSDRALVEAHLDALWNF